MRTWFAAILLVAAGVAAWLWMSNGTPPVSPPSAVGSGTTPRPQEEPAPPERAAANPELSTPAAPLPDVAEPPAPPPDDPTAAPVTLVMRVRDVATGAPVARFTWRFEVDGEATRGDGAAGEAACALPPGRTGRLLVEADGMQPFARDQVATATPPAAPTPLDVFLTPTVVAAGVTLFVHDLAQQPIQHVRVDAFRVDPAARDSAWHLGRALWARQADAADGRYRLPPLPEGEIGVLLLAVDESGLPLPLLPYRRTFASTGQNGFVEDVPLEPGCVLVLELVDALGQPFDPTTRGAATLDLRLPGGPATSRMWRTAHAAGTASAVDAVPGVGTIWAAEPLPGGAYDLRVSVGGAVRTQQPMFLRNGDRQVERVVVP